MEICSGTTAQGNWGYNAAWRDRRGNETKGKAVFQNVGVRKHGRRNLGYALYTEADVAEALTVSERAGSVKSNLSGKGWEEGRVVTVVCSHKGRI